MPLLTEQIAVILSALFFLALVFHLAAWRPTIVLALGFVLISLVWRTMATAFVDVAGPVYASQLQRDVGPGMATPLHVLAYVILLVPFAWFFRQSSMRERVTKRAKGDQDRHYVTFADVIAVVSLLVIVALYVEMFLGGVIPLLVGMERFEYTGLHAGPLHQFFIEFGNFVAFAWGLLSAVCIIRSGRGEFRFLALLLLLLVYMLLAGNRFSIFYSYCTFFLIPYAGVLAVRGENSERAFGWLLGAFSARERRVLSLAAIFIGCLVVVGLTNSLINVRGYKGDEVLGTFLERTFVQPSELSWVSYERVFLLGNWRSAYAFNSLFISPIDGSRNTTPQYLMLETIGEPRTSEHILRGFQFAGGFPEIFFELFGPIYAWLFLLAAGVVTAGLTAIMIRAVVEEHLATAFMAFYVLFGPYVMYIGGMLNFLLPWTYWAKMIALAVAMILERGLSRIGVRLVPWTLWRRRVREGGSLVSHLKAAKQRYLQTKGKR